MTGKKRILVVDDESELRECYREILAEEFDCLVDEAPDGQKGFELFLQNDYNLVITDHRMPRMTGAELIAAIRDRSNRPEVPIVLVTGFLDEALTSVHNGQNIYFLEKPVSRGRIVGSVRLLLKIRENDAA